MPPYFIENQRNGSVKIVTELDDYNKDEFFELIKFEENFDIEVDEIENNEISYSEWEKYNIKGFNIK